MGEDYWPEDDDFDWLMRLEIAKQKGREEDCEEDCSVWAG